MGFLDQVAADVAGEGTGGGDYVTEEETNDIIAKSLPFTISAVSTRPSPFDKDKEQYVLTIQLAGEDRLKTFTKGVASRDRSLDALMDSGELDAGPVGPVTLRRETSKAGRPVVLFATV